MTAQKTVDHATLSRASEEELLNRNELYDLFKNCPIPPDQMLDSLGLFLTRRSLSRILFMHELYQQILDVHGIIVEFGTRWGQNLALFQAMRGIYEPYNHNRRIVCFDTFKGFLTPHEKDGETPAVFTGGCPVTENYQEYLDRVADTHAQESPLAHMKRHFTIAGDAATTFSEYLDKNPETIIAMAYFDMDLYEPTRVCLERTLEHVTKGSVLGFDELNHDFFPGETRAFKEVLGLSRYRLRRNRFNPTPSYIVIE